MTTAEPLLIGPDHPLWSQAAASLLGAQTSGDAQAIFRSRRLEHFARQAGMNLAAAVTPGTDGAVRQVVLEILCPGALAALMLPEYPNVADTDALARLVGVLLRASFGRGARFAQALVHVDDAVAGEALSQAGFAQLAELTYVERKSNLAPPPCPLHAGLIEFRRAYEFQPAQLVRALDATYVNSADCVKLRGLRRTEDVLSTHRATGRHDPSDWFVAVQSGEAVGVLLLSRCFDSDAYEIVYMGVDVAKRRAGIGHGLLRQAHLVAARKGNGELTLAVDQANAPAMAMYRRWGFCETSRRQAWFQQNVGDAPQCA